MKNTLDDDVSKSMLLVLAHDALISDKGLPNVEMSSLVRLCLPRLQKLLNELMEAKASVTCGGLRLNRKDKLKLLLPGWSIQQESIRANLPRYVRVNNIRTSMLFLQY